MIKCSTFRHNFSITFTKQQHYTVSVSLANYQEPFQTLIFQQNFWHGVAWRGGDKTHPCFEYFIYIKEN